MPADQGPQLAFSLEEYRRRLTRVREAAERHGFDVLVLNRPENIYYLTGYQTLGYALGRHGYQVLIVPVEAEPCLVIRYGERSNVWARSWLQNMALYRDTDDPVAATRAVLEGLRPRRIGLEKQAWFLTPALAEQLAAAAPAPVGDGSGLVEEPRMIKSAEELAYVEAAARVSSTAVQAGLEAVGEGKTDRDVAAAVWAALVLAGGEYPGLPPLIAVGPQTTLFHATWSGQPIGEGDVVFIEVPGVVGRYLAPLARSACLGTPPDYVKERYAILLESLETGIAAMRPGATCAEVYEAFAKPVTRAGYEVPIGVGYSVGITFPPRWGESALGFLPGNPIVLQPGMVFHTPRTIRVYGEQTPIVSETTVITETGHRVLTSAPRELQRR